VDGAPRDADAFAPQLPPHLPRPVDLLVLVPHAPNLLPELLVAPGPGRSLLRILLLRLPQEVRRRSDGQDRTDRLDSLGVPVVVDAGPPYFPPPAGPPRAC